MFIYELLFDYLLLIKTYFLVFLIDSTEKYIKQTAESFKLSSKTI